jgi:hypothetical protein
MAMLAALIVAFTTVVTVADARPRHKHHAKKQLKPESFDGSCEFSGNVQFTPPMTSTPQSIAQHADAPGTCTGTFVDRYGGTHRVDAAASTYRAESSGDAVSCAFGLATGTGTLGLPDGEISFAMYEYRGGATPLIRLTGTNGGEAWMAVAPSESSDPAAALEACNGAGLEEFELDAHMQTVEALRG